MSLNAKYDFSSKVALVTGSSSGIGAAIAIQLAQYGAKVAITGRNAENLDKVASQIVQVSGGAKPLQIIGDLLDDTFPEKLITQTIAEFGQLNILVNNAGGTVPNGTLANPDFLAEFDQVLKLNLRAPVELIQLAIPYLEKTKGNIVNISSIASMKPWHLPYSTAKAGLDMVTKTSALELGPKGIRVNSVNPGPVVTPFTRSMGITNQAEHDKIFESYIEASLLKSIGHVEDIANLTSFLASDDAKNITGSIMISDSGWMLK